MDKKIEIYVATKGIITVIRLGAGLYEGYLDLKDAVRDFCALSKQQQLNLIKSKIRKVLDDCSELWHEYLNVTFVIKKDESTPF